MKFTNGFWCIREEIEPVYAVEYYDCDINHNNLVIYAATKPICNRGDIPNQPMLTITLSSPLEDVIKVSIEHFRGGVNRGPEYEIAKKDGDFISVNEGEDRICFQSGNTRAIISKEKKAWRIEYRDKENLLTETSYRNIAYMKNKAAQKNYLCEQLLLDVGENIYGLGERYTPYVKNGQTVEIWNEDGGTSSDQTYKNIPFYVSNRGYGVFVSHPGDVHFEVGSEKVERVQFSVETERLEYYILNGKSPKGTVKLFTELTGKPALPPAWSFGLWLTTSFTTSYDEETVTSFIDGMKERNIPLHTFHFDSFWMKGFEWCNLNWDDEVFSDPVGMIERYKERGLHICLWINSYIGQKSLLFDEGVNKGYFVLNQDGSVWQVDTWQPGMALVDFTNPQACKWYQDKLEVLLDMGVDCFKTDFGERIPVTGIKYYDGSDPVKMHNYYTYLYNKTVFELMEKKRGRDQAMVFARSATAGGQKFPVHWGGDTTATYQSMAEELRGGLSLSLSGFGFWSHDIGGFEQTASADVYKRWCAFGLLSSHSRLHGSTSYRVPWLFDNEACEVLKKFVNMKCRLMPYLFQQAVIAHKEGIPVMRPMLLEFSEDLTCEVLDRQYMLGDSLLVAPVFSQTGMVSYYLPKGIWTNYLTGEKRDGEKWHQEKFDYFNLPLLVRENTILAVGNNTEDVEYDYTENLTLRIYQIGDGRETSIKVADKAGKEKVYAEASRKGQVITIKVEGATNWRAEYFGVEELEIIKS